MVIVYGGSANFCVLFHSCVFKLLELWVMFADQCVLFSALTLPVNPEAFPSLFLLLWNKRKDETSPLCLHIVTLGSPNEERRGWSIFVEHAVIHPTGWPTPLNFFVWWFNFFPLCGTQMVLNFFAFTSKKIILCVIFY